MFKLKKYLKFNFIKKNIPLLVVIFILSFLFGNIFGLNCQKILINDPGILFFFVPILLEIVNYFARNFKQKYNQLKFYSIFVSLRRGFLLGVFIEALKVGS